MKKIDAKDFQIIMLNHLNILIFRANWDKNRTLFCFRIESRL